MFNKKFLSNLKQNLNFLNLNKFYSTNLTEATIVEVGPRDGLQNEKVILKYFNYKIFKDFIYF